MPKFIRNYIAGGTYFFTLVTSDRTKFFTDERYIESFLSAISTIQKYHHFDLIIWQKRFWEHTIRDQEDFQDCFDYIHYNPIKHGYSDKYDWEWSSFWKYYGDGEKAIPDIDPKKFQHIMNSYGE